MRDLQIGECKRNILCIDCDDTDCIFQGKRESDCPKYHCDNINEDCNKCRFLDKYIEEMRKTYGKV